MKVFRPTLAVTACLALAATALADHVYHTRPATCEPGYTIVEEVCYRDVTRQVCKVVADVKKVKKWVYSIQDDPFCLPKAPPLLGGHLGRDGCNDCQRCSEPQSRHLLVKREVVCEEPTTKCVIENVVEKVPYTVYRKVPCTQAPVIYPVPPPTGKK